MAKRGDPFRRLKPLRRKGCAQWLLCCLTIGALPAPATAQLTAVGPSDAEGPSLAVELAELRESNPLRLRPERSATGDSALVSTADGAYRQRWGRQQLAGHGRVTGLHYSNEARLNHETYRVGVQADLETVGELGARLSWLRQRDALDGQLRLDPDTGQRRLQTWEQVGAILQWGARRRWSLQSDWQHDQLQPNRPQVWWPGYEQDTWRLQLRTDLGRVGIWSLGRRQQEGTQKAVDRTVSQAPAVDYRLGVWDVEWSWQRRPGDAVMLRGSNGNSLRKPQAFPSADSASPLANPASSSAVNSLLAEVRWQPTTVLSIQAVASRDRGQQTQATPFWVNGEGLALQGAHDVRQVRVGIQWDLQPHWQLAFNRQRLDRTGEQSWYLGPDANAALPRSTMNWQDRLERRSMGITWQISRRAMAQCTLRSEARSGIGADDLRTGPDAASLQWKDRMVLCRLRWQFAVPT